jgi:VanZ family protein
MKESANNNVNLKPIHKWIVVGIYLILVTYLSLAPSDTFRTNMFNIPYRDKIVHFFMYGFFVIILQWAMNLREISRPKNFLILIVPVCYGVLMEVLQLVFAWLGRSFEVGDIIANVSGATLFWLIGNHLFQTKKTLKIK